MFGFYIRIRCFEECSDSQKYEVLKGRIRCIFRVFRGHFYCMRGPLLVEPTGEDNSAASTVAVIRMYSKEFVWPSYTYKADFGSTG